MDGKPPEDVVAGDELSDADYAALADWILADEAANPTPKPVPVEWSEEHPSPDSLRALGIDPSTAVAYSDGTVGGSDSPSAYNRFHRETRTPAPGPRPVVASRPRESRPRESRASGGRLSQDRGDPSGSGDDDPHLELGRLLGGAR